MQEAPGGSRRRPDARGRRSPAGSPGCRAMRGEFEEARSLWSSASARLRGAWPGTSGSGRALHHRSRHRGARRGSEAAAARAALGLRDLGADGREGSQGSRRRLPCGVAFDGRTRRGRSRLRRDRGGARRRRRRRSPGSLPNVSRARIIARSGNPEDAESSRAKPLAMIADTDYPDLQAIVFLSQAEVGAEAACSEADEALQLRNRARAACEQKRNVVAARRMVHASTHTGGAHED